MNVLDAKPRNFRTRISPALHDTYSHREGAHDPLLALAVACWASEYCSYVTALETRSDDLENHWDLRVLYTTSKEAGTRMTTRHEDWQRLVQQMPPSVRTAISTELWRRDLLWALDLPVESVPITTLAWLFDVPCWQLAGVPFQVTPNAVRADPARYHEQYRRTLATDLAYPIHLVTFHGRWTVLDGLHRLLKADMLGRADIPAKKLSAEDFQGILDRPGATA